MRSTAELFARLCCAEHLERAAGATVRGKRRRRDVAWFLFALEDRLAELCDELASGSYQPGPCDLVAIRDPKPRLISRTPIRDRVVHTALVMLIEPVFEPSYSSADFACRPGYGTHRAVLELQRELRRYRYALHLDLRSYFPSIDPDILLGLLSRRLRDTRFLAVVERVLAAGRGLSDAPERRQLAGLAPDWPPPGRGLPIGWYTSQLFAAHVYLNAFDHFVKRELKVPGYLRYVDDLFFFGDQRGQLEACREAASAWLLQERGLRLKHPQAGLLSCRDHLDALGYRIERNGLACRPRALRRLERRAALELAGAPGPDFERSVASTVGVALF